jgi:hypothetical protein
MLGMRWLQGRWHWNWFCEENRALEERDVWRFFTEGASISPHLLCSSEWAVVTTAQLAAPCICGKLGA